MKTIFLITLLLGTLAHANAPQKYSKCSLKIKEPKESQGYFMDESCTTAYVKPPVNGRLELAGYVPALGFDDCKLNMSLIDLMRRTSNHYAMLKKELDARSQILEKNNQKLNALKRECRTARTESDSFRLSRDQTSIELESEKNKLAAAEEKQRSCEAQSQVSCEKAKTDIQRAQKRISNLNKTLIQQDADLDKSEASVSSCENRVEAEKKAVLVADQDYNDLSERLFDAEADLIKLHDDRVNSLLQKPGGQVMVGFYSEHHKLVKEFEALNSGSDVSFRAIPIKNATLHADMVTDGYKSALPVQLRSDVFGLLPSGNIEGLKPEEVTPDDGTEQKEKTFSPGIRFGEGAAGTIIINRYAACSMASDMNKKDGEEFLRQIANTLKPTITFNYQVQVKRDINIKYNEENLYHLVKKSMKKKRLFRSSSSLSITEKSESKQWIDIEISAEDETAKFTDPEKLMMDLRREHLDRYLRKKATKYYKTEEQANLIEPGPDGATIAAKELRENCFNYYCQVAAIALNIASGIAGSSSSEASLKKTMSDMRFERLREKIPVSEYGQQTLKLSRAKNE